MSTGRYEGLDAIRGVAAICVLLYHAKLFAGLPYLGRGYLAVDIFFALSGFVIAAVYTGRLSASLTPMQFAIQRFWRFYPLYLTGTAIGIAFVAVQMHFGKSDVDHGGVTGFIFSLLMLPTLNKIGSDVSLYTYNGPAWSLFFEYLVNLLFCFALVRLSTRMLSAIAIASVAVLALLAFRDGNLEGGPWWPGAYVGLMRAVTSFTIGVLIYRCRDRLPAVPDAVAIWLPVVMILAFFFDPQKGVGGATYDLLVALVLSPLMIIAMLRLTYRPLGRSVFGFLSEISFALYAIHLPLVLLFGSVYNRLYEKMGLLAYLYGYVFCGAVIGLAWLLTVFLDEPIRAYIKKRTKASGSGAGRKPAPYQAL